MTEHFQSNRERTSLWEQITQVSFLLDDLRLFLDTHPTDREAQTMYCNYAKQRSDLIDTYTETYGPLDAYCADCRTDNQDWNWTNAPMPWESEAN